MKNFCSRVFTGSKTLSDLSHTEALPANCVFSPFPFIGVSLPPPPYTSCIPNSVPASASSRTQIDTVGTRNGLREQKVKTGFGN